MKFSNITYHRNGIAGAGFWAADCKHEGESLVVLRTLGRGKAGVGCFVISREQGASSCWRGDHFAEGMDAAIEAYKAANWQTV